MHSQQSVHVDGNCTAMIQKANITEHAAVNQIVLIDQTNNFDSHKVGLLKMIELAHNCINTLAGEKSFFAKMVIIIELVLLMTYMSSTLNFLQLALFK
jgi:hypothetical protein